MSEGYVGGVGGYDVVGGEEVGAGSEMVSGVDMVGAPPSWGQRPRRNPPIAGLGQVRVMSDKPDVARRQISPIPITTVGAGSTASVEVRPQRPIRIERLIIDGASLAGLYITDLLIGAEPQFVNAGGVPAGVFAPTAFGTDLRGNTAQPGISVTINFQNTTGAPITFGGAFIGTSLT